MCKTHLNVYSSIVKAKVSVTDKTPKHTDLKDVTVSNVEETKGDPTLNSKGTGASKGIAKSDSTFKFSYGDVCGKYSFLTVFIHDNTCRGQRVCNVDCTYIFFLCDVFV